MNIVQMWNYIRCFMCTTYCTCDRWQFSLYCDIVTVHLIRRCYTRVMTVFMWMSFCQLPFGRDTDVLQWNTGCDEVTQFWSKVRKTSGIWKLSGLWWRKWLKAVSCIYEKLYGVNVAYGKLHVSVAYIWEGGWCQRCMWLPPIASVAHVSSQWGHSSMNFTSLTRPCWQLLFHKFLYSCNGNWLSSFFIEFYPENVHNSGPGYTACQNADCY